MSAIDRLSVPAVRYALGRRTYIVHDVTETLTAHRADLDVRSRQAIVRDIDDAEARGALGDEVDAKAWRALRDALLDLGGLTRIPSVVRKLEEAQP